MKGTLNKRFSMNKYIFLPIICIALAILPQCGELLIKTHDSECQTITIWVHGTRLTPPFLAPHFFYHKAGFTPAYYINHESQWHKIADTLIKQAPHEYSWDTFYFFGWSGKLSTQERLTAARDLSAYIHKLIDEHNALYGYAPKIRIITHSHGGNVALNLARIEPEISYVIDELILLACPVQKQTAELIASGLFKSIYSLYSRFDTFQVMDMQGFQKDENGDRIKHPLMSKRTFKGQPNLTQVQLKWKRRGVMHIEFIMETFLKYLPGVLNELRSSHTNALQRKVKKLRMKIIG